MKLDLNQGMRSVIAVGGPGTCVNGVPRRRLCVNSGLPLQSLHDHPDLLGCLSTDVEEADECP